MKQLICIRFFCWFLVFLRLLCGRHTWSIPGFVHFGQHINTFVEKPTLFLNFSNDRYFKLKTKIHFQYFCCNIGWKSRNLQTIPHLCRYMEWLQSRSLPSWRYPSLCEQLPQSCSECNRIYRWMKRDSPS